MKSETLSLRTILNEEDFINKAINIKLNKKKKKKKNQKKRSTSACN